MEESNRFNLVWVGSVGPGLAHLIFEKGEKGKNNEERRMKIININQSH